jgi:hypothetical protein
MNVLTKLPGFLLRKPKSETSNSYTTKHRTSATLYADPKVDYTEPPGNPPAIPGYGSYCFRARTTMVNRNEPSNELNEFTGYDDKMNIVDKVEQYCERTRHNDNHQCTPTSLTFIGQSEVCDGRVVMYDKVHNFSKTYF